MEANGAVKRGVGGEIKVNRSCQQRARCIFTLLGLYSLVSVKRTVYK